MNTVDWRAKGKALGAQHKAAGVSRPATAMMFANRVREGLREELAAFAGWDHEVAVQAAAEGYATAWDIVGGESGPRARPCRVAWIRRVVEQCRAQGVPVFVKQLGAYVVDRNDAGFLGGPDDAWDVHPDAVEHDLDGTRDGYQGAPVRVHLASKKGGDMGDWPADLRVREMPQGGVL